MEEKMRHLELIQNVMSRMASNSFLLKGWTVTLVVGLLAFANISEMNSNFMLFSPDPRINLLVPGWLLYSPGLAL
ncbi:hypothetical protein RKD55_004738 [Rossellomorea marisflavi]